MPKKEWSKIGEADFFNDTMLKGPLASPTGLLYDPGLM